MSGPGADLILRAWLGVALLAGCWGLGGFIFREVRGRSVEPAEPAGRWHATRRDGTPCACDFGRGHASRYAAVCCAFALSRRAARAGVLHPMTISFRPTEYER